MNGTELFNKVVSGALAIPGVGINRDEYFKETLTPFVTEDMLSLYAQSPVSVP